MSLTITLTYQTGDHPVITPSGTHATGETVSIVKEDPQVDRITVFYVRNFSDRAKTSHTDFEVPLSPGSPYRHVPNAYGPYGPVPRKQWLGFAYTGRFADPAAYFTAHPYDPTGHHHTVEIEE